MQIELRENSYFVAYRNTRNNLVKMPALSSVHTVVTAHYLERMTIKCNFQSRM